MQAERFYQLLDDPTLYGTEIQQLRRIANEYPYFQQGIFLYLRALYKLDENYFHNELQRFSILVSDRKALFYFIYTEEYGEFFKKTGKTEIPADKTSVLLEAFFNNNDTHQEEGALEYEIASTNIASSDYFNYLNVEPEVKKAEEQDRKEGKKEAPPLKHQSIIDSFIEKSNDGKELIHIDKESLKLNSQDTYDLEDDTDNEGLTDDIFFTETLAKIYIKQKRYDKAYKIIQHLSLNYPKKNVYFADQLSFLEKLIINSKYKDIK